MINLTPQALNVQLANAVPALPGGLTLVAQGTKVMLTGRHGTFADQQTQINVTAVNGSTANTSIRLVIQTQVAAPQNVKAAKTGNDVVLTWTTSGTGYAQYAKIYKGATQNFVPAEANRIATLAGTVLTYTDVGGGSANSWYVVRIETGLNHVDAPALTWSDPSFNDLVTAAGPIGWWRLDDANVADNATAANSGSVVMNGQFTNANGTTVARVAAIRKGSTAALQVVGNGSSYFKVFYSTNLPMLNAMNQGQSFTAFFWVKPTAVGGGLLLQAWGGSGGGRLNWTNTGVAHPANTNRFTHAALALNVPHFVCLTKDVAAGEYRMMVDGVWQTQAVAYSDLAIAGNDQMALSGRASNSPTGMAGSYSDLVFFNKALTKAQIEAIYNAGKL